MNAKAKTISLLLHDGDLRGVITVDDTSWNSGELYSAPRNSVQKLIDTNACNKYGVYFLLSIDKVYIGQSSDLARRLSEHLDGKDWWENAVILTTKDDSFNHADIDYLESMFIEKARTTGKLDCNNGTKGNPRKVSKFREVFLNQYLDEALFLMRLIGISVFTHEKPSGSDTSSSAETYIIDTMDSRTRLKIGTRAKGTAVRFVKDHGIDLGESVSYSSLQINSSDFWINPQSELLSKDWQIILNDTQSNLLIVLEIPAGTLSLRSGTGNGLVVRADRPQLINLRIDRSSLVDRTSGIDFSPFCLIEIPY